ncbi:class I SAM-dependent methyltransferase [Pseudomonas abietaniphila]|uniref:class I SAM-dependent methyltransferase n=1 Tax=Pseudomonas abietaniphila TaxID=89065 RepID=UPI003217C363
MTESHDLRHLYNVHAHNVSDKWSSYLDTYESVLSPYKADPVKLLEIGVQNGGSLEIWAKYFENSKLIAGCDINSDCEKIKFDAPSISLLIGDINNHETLQKLKSISEKFDIIIDDGSHTSGDIIMTFFKVFPMLNLGGIYIIEDLHCSYWKQFDGGLNSTHSSIAFLKCLVDILNFEHWGLDKDRLHHLDAFDVPIDFPDNELASLHSIEFKNSMCIIKKKASLDNILGRRRVAGSLEVVSPVKYVDNTYNNAPAQSLEVDASKDNGQNQDSTQQRVQCLENELPALKSNCSPSKTDAGE